MKKNFAFVFPGQGSQSPGMLDAWGDHPAVRACLQEASEALGEDIAVLIATGSKETLAQTTNTQPAMLVAGVAAWCAWRQEGGPAPAMMAGHSLGEYSALVASGVLTLGQAAPLVRLRAQAMQEAVPQGQGAMAAVLGLAADQVAQTCFAVTQELQLEYPQEVVEAVNFNDPLQTVIAGSALAVEKACLALKTAGAKRTLSLPVSAPFHSRLMKPAAERLARALVQVEMKLPQIPVLNNIDVRVESQPPNIRDALYRQAFGPVRWVESVQSMRDQGVMALVECGPGKVLSGMSKRIAPALMVLNIFDPASMEETRHALEKLEETQNV